MTMTSLILRRENTKVNSWLMNKDNAAYINCVLQHFYIIRF